VSYPGQLKQCHRCFGQGHINATCEATQKVDWLEYVSSLLESGKFKQELFEGWLPILRANHPKYQENADLRDVLDFGRINRPYQGSFQGRQGSQIPFDPHRQSGTQANVTTQGYYQNRGGFNQPNWRSRGRGRGRGRNQSFVLQQY